MGILLNERQERERKFFNEHCSNDSYAGWREFSLAGWRNYRPIRQAALNYVGPVQGKRVLLCGVGPECVLFARAGAEVFGFDVSESQVESASKLAQRCGLASSIHVDCMPFEHLTYANRFFDMALGLAILHHIDLPTGATELARVLKKGARASFIEPLGENPLLEFARRRLPYPGKSRTCDEQPLRYSDIEKFGAAFAITRAQEYALLSSARRFIRSRRLGRFLDTFDGALTRIIPATRSLCSMVWVGVEA